MRNNRFKITLIATVLGFALPLIAGAAQTPKQAQQPSAPTIHETIQRGSVPLGASRVLQSLNVGGGNQKEGSQSGLGFIKSNQNPCKGPNPSHSCRQPKPQH